MYGQPGFGQPAYGQPMGFAPNPGYQQPSFQQPGFQQPVFQQAPPAFIQPGVYRPPPPPQQGPIVITMGSNNNGGATKCPACHTVTDDHKRLTNGCVTWSWCMCLLATTGFLCWIPFCSDGCKDVEFLCEKCSQVKNKIPAKCC